jgi:hypothetical protein
VTEDQFRIDLLQAVVVEAVFLQRAGLEVLDQHVGFCDQLADQRLAFGQCMIDCHRLLVAVAGQIERGDVGRLAVLVLEKRRAVGARLVAAAGPLDLDHVGAEIGEQLRRQRRREHARQVEYAYAFECDGWHRRYSGEAVSCR